MPQFEMAHDIDPAEDLLKRLGDLSGVELFQNQVLVAVYIRPKKTKSGLYLSDSTVDEDRYQSKVGLLVKAGPSAFVDDADTRYFDGMKFEIGKDWLVFRPSDGWNITVNNVLCRILVDTSVRGRTKNVDMIY